MIILKGPDRVRKRPEIVFDSTDIKGVINAVKLLLDIFITEVSLGFSKRIYVTIHKDNSISIKSYDRGFILDETIIEGKPAWYQSFCELYCGPREADDDYYYYLGNKHHSLYEKSESLISKYKLNTDHSFDLCCVQYASKYMHVEATKDGIKKTLDFEKGFCVSDMRKEASTEENNTFIRFLPDSEVFKNTIISDSNICDYLNEIAMSLPGTICNYKDERIDFMTKYHYPRGAHDYVVTFANNPTEMYINEIKATGKDRYNKNEYSAIVRVHICFVADSGKTQCFHNYKELENGGNHLDAIKEKLIDFINWEFAYDFGCDTCKKIELSFSDIKDKVVLIVESTCPESYTNYINATRTSINNRMITDMSQDILNQDFKRYLKMNHDEIFDILLRNK